MMSYKYGLRRLVSLSRLSRLSSSPSKATFDRSFGSYASNPLLRVDLSKPASDQPSPVHNRWHPEIPSVASIEPGGPPFRVECLDWTGGQIKNNESADDIQHVDLTQVHYLSGPIEVKGAKAGDVLVVDILDVGPLPSSMWGFTGIFARDNGGGFLTNEFPFAHKAIWDFEGIYAASRHIHNVRFPGLVHPGLIGCAPSYELLQKWNQRENELISSDPCRVPPLACPPEPHGACLGQISKSSDSAKFQRIAKEAARTVPPREHGGNCDIKNLSKGSKLYLPVYVPGAKLSMGDLHFSQGDGEITFCGAIEMAGFIDLRVNLIPGGMTKLNMTHPIFKPGPVEPRFQDYLTFEGISVDKNGKQHYLDANLAYERACLSAIDYLTRFGYTREQAYILLGTAPVEGRISGIVDIPNACCTLAIPTSIFDFDIRPEATPQNKQRGTLAKTSKQ